MNQKMLLAGLVAGNIGIAAYMYSGGDYAFAACNLAGAVFCYIANFCEVKP